MADALLGSRAVFRSRAAELGLEDAAIEKAVAESIGTMGGFGFACRFVPGIHIKIPSNDWPLLIMPFNLKIKRERKRRASRDASSFAPQPR